MPDIRPAVSSVALLLNATYEPLCVVSVRRAAILVLTGKAICVADGDGVLHSSRQHLPVPLVAPFARKMGDMSRKLIWQRMHKGTMNDRARAIAQYNQHIEDVKAAVPSEQLLIFTVDQGGEPLCKFLGVPVPVGPFPNVNDRAQIKKVIAGMTVGAYVMLAVGAVIVAGLIYGAMRLFG